MTSLPRHREVTEAPAPPFQQTPTYASNYPTEAELRPQSHGGSTPNTFVSNPSSEFLRSKISAGLAAAGRNFENMVNSSRDK